LFYISVNNCCMNAMKKKINIKSYMKHAALKIFLLWTPLLCILQEPKKMIRYLDSKVVSMKGEKFTEIKKAEDESLKNTYINLKPARQYRFHWCRSVYSWMTTWYCLYNNISILAKLLSFLYCHFLCCHFIHYVVCNLHNVSSLPLMVFLVYDTFSVKSDAFYGLCYSRNCCMLMTWQW